MLVATAMQCVAEDGGGRWQLGMRVLQMHRTQLDSEPDFPMRHIGSSHDSSGACWAAWMTLVSRLRHASLLSFCFRIEDYGTRTIIVTGCAISIRNYWKIIVL